MHPGDGCSSLAAHSVMTHTESWFGHVSLSPPLCRVCSQGPRSRRLRQMAQASRLRATTGGSARAPPPPHTRRVLLPPPQAAKGINSHLLGWGYTRQTTADSCWSIYQCPMLLNCKNMDLASSKRKVKWHISLRPIWQRLPKTKEQARTDLVHTPEQDSRRTWGLWEREKDW